MKRPDFANSEAVPTEDGSYSLKHPDHGELFHSYAGAAREARDLYLGASSIEARWAEGGATRVLDVGLGLGYNALTTLAAYSRTGQGQLEVVSLELEVELVELLRSAQAAWQAGWPESWLEMAGALIQVSPTVYEAAGKGWYWKIHCGDAIAGELAGSFDYIWQDPFSPSKNPRMWSEEWFHKLRRVSHARTELLSYSVSRAVKDALCGGGWSFERIPTTTTKRHWLRAVPLPSSTT